MPVDSQRLPPTASCPHDCLVGPTESELTDSSSFVFWGRSKAEQRKKDVEVGDDCPSKRRKHCDGHGKRQDQSALKQSTHTTHISTGTSTGTNSFQKAINTFLSSGCCYFEKPVLPPQFVKTCLDRAKTDYRFLEGLMEKERQRLLKYGDDDDDDDTEDADVTKGNSRRDHNRHHRMVALTRQDYAEWVARDGGRVDIRYGLNRYPYNCGGLIYNSIVFPLVQALLNGNQNEDNEPVQLLYAGVMWGMPVGDGHDNSNSSSCNLHQKWHADGGHLFSPHQLPDGLTLPPHCVNVFYPLVDLTKDNGPTEFRIASHRFDHDKASNKNAVEFPLTCPAGGAVLFDYRIQHRGRANLLPKETSRASSLGIDSDVNIDRARPVLYLAYAKTYFKDHGNTRSGRRLVPRGTDSLWTTRTLEGRPLPYGKGFENYSVLGRNSDHHQLQEDYSDGDAKKRNAKNHTIENPKGNVLGIGEEAVTTTDNNCEGVGERWVLFQMTLELPDGKSEILKVYGGDVAVEVAQQFCFKHGLQNDFVPVLAQTIQGQMDSCS